MGIFRRKRQAVPSSSGLDRLNAAQAAAAEQNRAYLHAKRWGRDTKTNALTQLAEGDESGQSIMDIITARQLQLSDRAGERQEAYWGVEDNLRREAMGEWNEAEGRYTGGAFSRPSLESEYVRMAKEDTAIAFGNERAARERRMSSMGIDPSSGRGMAGDRHAGLAEAAATAGAVNSARRAAKTDSFDKRLAVSGMGSGLASLSMGGGSGAVGTANQSFAGAGNVRQGAISGAAQAFQMKSHNYNASQQRALQRRGQNMEMLGTAVGYFG